jgi:hypothetical protein
MQHDTDRHSELPLLVHKVYFLIRLTGVTSRQTLVNRILEQTV